MKSGTAETGTEMSCLIEPPPKGLRLIEARGDYRIGHDAALGGRRKQLPHRFSQAFLGLRRQLDEHVPRMRRGQGIAATWGMLLEKVEADPRHQLEGGDAFAGPLACELEQLQCGGGRGESHDCRLRRARARKQLEHRGGDDAERALGADKEIFQIVAGVVLLQLVQTMPDAPVGEHHFQAQGQIARDAISERAGAPGIGRKVAADGAASLGAKRKRKQAVRRRRRFLGRREDDARFAGHRVGRGVNFANAVKP